MLGNLLVSPAIGYFTVIASKLFALFRRAVPTSHAQANPTNVTFPPSPEGKQRAHEKHFSFLTWLSSRADIASRLACLVLRNGPSTCGVQ